MPKIQYLIDTISSSDPDIESALLQCKVLARRMNYPPLDDWATKELTGYAEQDELPDYRQFRTQPRGTLTNGFQYVTNHDVNPAVVGAELFCKMSDVSIFEGVRALKSQSGEAKLQKPLAFYEGQVNELYLEAMDGGHGFMGLHAPIPSSVHQSVLGAVRERLLTLLLDMDSIFPDEDDIESPSKEQRKEVAQAFTQVIHISNSSHFNIGDGNRIDDVTTVTQIRPGSVEDLSEFLRGAGLKEDDIGEIVPLLLYIYENDLDDSRREKVGSWLNDNAKKVGGEVTKEVLVQAFVHYAPAAYVFLSSIVGVV